MSLLSAILGAMLKGEKLSPEISTSTNYKHWVSIKDFRRCAVCKDMHGKIWLNNEIP